MNDKLINALPHTALALLYLAGVLLFGLLLAGCTAVKSVAQATKDKTIAAGSDTWGGGAAGSAATVENPTPTLDFWFGRRKVWYVSVKDKETGEAAAKVVKASNSSLDVSAGASGIGAKQ